MAIAANASSTLQTIQTKVRRLTQSPSVAQLTDTQLQEYINTFVIYDFPEHLRMFNLRRPFSFYCNPYQTLYATDISISPNNPLYNFQNKYITVHPPVYIAGFNSFYTQNREEFFGIYPQVNNIAQQPGIGDSATQTFTGVINANQSQPPSPGTQRITLEQNNVLFTSIDANNNGLTMVDVPMQDSATGNLTVFGNLYDPYVGLPPGPIYYPANLIANNNINYLTGQYTVTFTTAPGTGQVINSQSIPLAASRPLAMLWHDNKFRLRPVPDQPYKINFEVYIRPTALLNTDQVPGLEEWWQYIAYGAAKKIFEDRMDLESVGLIMPEFKKQEALCQRRTIVQYTNERVATIYTDSNNGSGGFGGGFGWGGGGSF